MRWRDALVYVLLVGVLVGGLFVFDIIAPPPHRDPWALPDPHFIRDLTRQPVTMSILVAAGVLPAADGLRRQLDSLLG
ncbi:MAG: hypothetical protein ABMA64_24965 [Myxococcota bacterium]